MTSDGQVSSPKEHQKDSSHSFPLKLLSISFYQGGVKLKSKISNQVMQWN